MEPLRIFTFGGLRVYLGKTPIGGFETRKAEALLAYLACNPRGYDRGYRREVLAELLWDERSQQQALSNLRVVLANLRKSLRPYLAITRENISLNPEAPIWVDCAEFEARLNPGRSAAHAGSEPETREIEGAVELYQGEFLEGFYLRESRGFEAWLVQERERLRRRAIQALHGLVEHDLHGRDFPTGITHVTRLLELDPLDELAHRQMMLLLFSSGRRSEALAQYETCRRLLWDEFGVEPEPETAALVGKIRTGELELPALAEAATGGEPAVPVANPYKGLRAFQEADADDFFGREAFTRRLVACLADAGELSRFLAIVGPSGSGKSSVVRAGLIPALRGGALPGSEQWSIVEMMPGSHPFEELEINLLRLEAKPALNLLEPLRRDARGILRAARLVLPAEDSQLLLVIDQFEELFTLVEDESETRLFLESLRAAATDPRSPVRVVITLRADFFDRPLMQPGFSKLLQDRTEVVLPLSVDELERAIRSPAERVGLSLEPGLATAIVADVLEQPGALPLLQYALTELFEQRADHRLTLERYLAIGGVQGVLERRAEETFAGLSAAGKAAARQAFLRLVSLGEGANTDGLAAPDTRRRVLRSELEAVALEGTLPASEPTQPGGGSAAAIAEVIEAFGKRRLLSFDWDPLTRSPTVEIAHEALLREWSRLRGWLEEGRADVRLQRALGSAAAEWTQAGRDRSFLLHGARLSDFESWAQQTDLALTQEERAFLEASLAEREAQRLAEAVRRQRETSLEQRARNVFRALVVVLLLATLGALALAWAARQAQTAAEVQADLSTSRALALMAVNNLETDPERSLLLSLHALRTAYTREAEEALHRALQTSRVRMTFAGHTGGARTVEWSPDGETLATASYAGEVIVWEAGSGQKRFSLPGRIARYSPDGSRLATGSEDGTVALWDFATRERLLTLQGRQQPVGNLRFGPDGKLLVSTGEDGALIVWDLESGEQQFASEAQVPEMDILNNVAFSPDSKLLIYSGRSDSGFDLSFWGADRDWDLIHRQPAYGVVVFSPDGRWLAVPGGAVSLSTDIVLWDLSRADLEALDLSALKPFVIPAAHKSLISNFAFSRDGTLLASTSQDSTAKIWKLSPEGPELLMVLAGHTQAFSDVAFYPDGTRLATASKDGTVRIWDISPAGAAEWFALAGHTQDVYRLALTQDGKYMATASSDGTAKVWDLESGTEVLAVTEHGGSLFGVAISPDGTRLATAGNDNTAKIWELNLSPGNAYAELKLTLEGHAPGPPVGELYPGLTAAVFSLDGTRLATGGVDGMAKVWDVETGQELLSVQAHPERRGITRLAFSADGQWLVVTSDGPEPLAKIFDAESGAENASFSGHSQAERIWGAAFSPDGTRVATGSWGGGLKIWDAQTGQELLDLIGHTSTVTGVAFSPDGKYLTTSSTDGTARVWDAASGERLQMYTSPTGAFFDAAFRPDGKAIIASGQGSIYGYVFDLYETIRLAETRLTRWFTPDECRQFLQEEECPER